MATYTYLGADLRTNAILAELPLTGVTADLGLNGVGTFQATLDLADPLVAEIDPIGSTQPGRSLVYIDRGGVLVQGAYIIWTRKYDSNTKKLTLGGQDLWSYFRRRLITVDTPFSGTDQLAIAQALLTNAQNVLGGDVGLTIGSERCGVLRDRNYYGYEFKPVAEAVEQLATVQNGFDFRINVAYDSSGLPAKTLVLGYPQIGQPANNTGLLFEFGDGGNINAYNYPEDSQTQDNVSYAGGSGDGPAMLISQASKPSLIDAGWPLLEDFTSYGDISIKATLDEHAQANLNAAANPVVIPEWDVNPDADPVFGSYICGDYARFVVTDERFPRQADGTAGYDKFQRITKISLACPDASGTAEAVTVSCGGTE